MDRSQITRLYFEACHGDGAEPRRKARAELEAIIVQSGQPMRVVFDDHGLSLGNYFASKPIS